MRPSVITFQTIVIIILGLMLPRVAVEALLSGEPAPEIDNQTWINSPPLKLADLRGKVVFLQFWTFG